jgi:hypothetical protein
MDNVLLKLVTRTKLELQHPSLPMAAATKATPYTGKSAPIVTTNAFSIFRVKCISLILLSLMAIDLSHMSISSELGFWDRKIPLATNNLHTEK